MLLVTCKNFVIVESKSIQRFIKLWDKILEMDMRQSIHKKSYLNLLSLWIKIKKKPIEVRLYTRGIYVPNVLKMYTVYSKDKEVGCHIRKWQFTTTVWQFWQVWLAILGLQGNLQSSFEWMGEQGQFLVKQSLNSQPFKLL